MTILHLYKLMHPSRVKPTPAGFFWLPYAALVVALIWVMA